MDKTKRHEKAEEFRRQITFPAQRANAINELLTKENFDASDRLRLMVLFQKKEYFSGCELPYRHLIVKIEQIGDEVLVKKAQSFSSKL